jgi:hypothetical protein
MKPLAKTRWVLLLVHLNENSMLYALNLAECNLNPESSWTVTATLFVNHDYDQMLQNVYYSTTDLQNYKIVHFEGKPQGPSLSFVSGSAVAPFVVALGVDVCVFFSVSVVFSSFAPVAPFVGVPSSQKLTLLTAFPNDSP